ncbi:hypothetical protein A2368_00225 [Candidatus Collierbacteria bacterium RIFOXYB1_FULL_49_13]|uniref:Uncharacterized protein n=1 Tax=Candidatus Collierbacteria bacterium RIFOXYB1_FULL_49_13 TaxID=1817728 RepID=A0A1F5FFD6_9BACT|nr:MAG: hypothetical protein A2368_00225 [Candidatus Collierbacteria bacterium RIFOXYB1_FULL_49_13]
MPIIIEKKKSFGNALGSTDLGRIALDLSDLPNVGESLYGDLRRKVAQDLLGPETGGEIGAENSPESTVVPVPKDLVNKPVAGIADWIEKSKV